MIRPIVRDPVLLFRPCTPATPADLDTAGDLLETLCAHIRQDRCVGMAENMIGVRKRVIALSCGQGR